jgi:hypothetical protein
MQIRAAADYAGMSTHGSCFQQNKRARSGAENDGSSDESGEGLPETSTAVMGHSRKTARKSESAHLSKTVDYEEGNGRLNSQ